MRFFTEIGGFIWECNSIGEYIGTIVSYIIGTILAWVIYLSIIALIIFFIFF